MRRHLTNNRLSAFFCLLGFAVLIPAYFLPAMLMTNFIEGSQWFSIWSGIVTFYKEGNYFLATLIFLFSVVFPLTKLALTFLSCLGTRWMREETAMRIVKITGWTAKYSMLDVLVIAMLIVLVKVDRYIRLEPTIGIYLFSLAILASVLANATFVPPSKQVFTESRKPWRRFAALGIGLILLAIGAWALRMDDGGKVDRVRTEPLNERPISRAMEQFAELAMDYQDSDDWLPDWRQVRDVFHALRDQPEVYLEVVKGNGGRASSPKIEVAIDKDFKQTWELGEKVAMRDIEKIALRSRVGYVWKIGTTVDEELLTVAEDPFRRYTRTWYGRIYKFELLGPLRPFRFIGWLCLGIGTVGFLAGCVGVLLNHRRASE